MATTAHALNPTHPARRRGEPLGYWMALLLTILTITAFALGITTPPRSGPFCTGNCIAAPYTDAAQYVPRDYYWVLPGMLVVPVFVIVVCCMAVHIEPRKRHLGLASLCFAAISAALISADYFIQLQAVMPSLVRGEATGLGLFTQYNPHGLFIAVEDLGYLMLSMSFLFAAVAFPTRKPIGLAIRWTFLVSFVLAILTFTGLAWQFGLNVEYRSEVAIIAIVWTTLIVAGILLSLYFRHAENPD